MNTIAIGIRYNGKVNLSMFQWRNLATRKAEAYYELGRLKRNAYAAIERVAIRRAVDRVAMAFNPMPGMAVA